MLRPSTKVFLVLTSLVISLVLLSEAISAVPKIPVTDLGLFNIPGMGSIGTKDGKPSGPLGDSNTTMGPSIDCLCPGINYEEQDGSRELLEIIGYTNTTYIRTQTAEIYNGTWTSLWEEGRFYTSGIVSLPWLDGYRGVVSFIVRPIIPFVGYTACTLDTYALDVGHLLTYYPSARTWYGYEAVSTEYRVESYVNSLELYALNWDSPLSQPEYLGVPAGLYTKLRPLALEITRDRQSTADQLLALEDYLRTHYTYDKNYTKPPEGVDPVDWFLFTEKRGVCGSFNSAFVLLSRSLGIPARLVVGYAVDPRAEAQVVTAGQAHAWAEVPFKGFGWVTFDATAGYTRGSGEPVWSERSGTFTTINEQANATVKGHGFIVMGTVVDQRGSPVGGMRVNIYIKPWKGASGLLCGSGLTFSGSGVFVINCTVPKMLPVGPYLIEAHSLGSEQYTGSSSDPPIRVLADTVLRLDLPEKILTDQSLSVNARLMESENEEGIAEAPCTVTVTNGTYRFSFQTMTSYNGGILSQVPIMSPGNWTVTVEFGGLGDWLGTRSSKVVRVLTLGINPKPLPVIVRGEPAAVEGRVHAEDIPGRDVEVRVQGGGLDEVVVTDRDGYFRVPYPTNVNSDLGPVTFKIFLPISGFRVITPGDVATGTVVEIYPEYPSGLDSEMAGVELTTRVCARTFIVVVEHESTHWHTPFTLRSVLIDDHSIPVGGANITMTTTQSLMLQGLTAENGSVRFVRTLEIQPSGNSIGYNLTFPGRDNLMSSHTTGQMLFITEYGLEELLPYAVPIVAACGAFYYAVTRRKPGFIKDAKPPTLVSAATEQNLEERQEEDTIGICGSGESMEVSFPQIAAPLPHTWEVSEPLEVAVKVSEYAEGEAIQVMSPVGAQTLTIAGGTALGVLTFSEKGLHKLTLRHEGGARWSEASIKLRVVNYREEIINLFNFSFKEIEKKLSAEVGSKTAREVLGIYTKNRGLKEKESLRTMLDVFEEASYSSHPLGRKHYEVFYAARLESFGGD